MNKKLLYLALIILFLCSGCNSIQGVTSIHTTQSHDYESLLEFSNCQFEDKTFTYDGKYHQLVVVGAPEGTNVVYSNNSQVEVGSYVVTATLSKEGYIDKTLTAHLNIIEAIKEFTGITFKSETIDYDGEAHSLVLDGAPEGAVVTYDNNNQIEVGKYTIRATVSLEGYKTKTYTATLSIVGKQITDVVFEDATYKYDGNPHSIYASNLPEGVEVSYTGNEKTYEGVYVVKATIFGHGYETLILTANLTISTKKDFPEYSFEDIYWIYDDRDIDVSQIFSSYEYSLNYNYTRYFDVVYRINGEIKTQPIIKNVGVYDVSATYSANNYDSKTFSFKITISDQIGGVDSNKTAYQFTNDTKFVDLYNEIKKGNYTVMVTCRDEFDYDHDGVYEKVDNSPNISYYYVTNEAFAGRHNEDSTEYSSNDFFIIKEADYAFAYEYDYFLYSKYKIPASCYLETVINISKGMVPFSLLKESETGGFEDSCVGGYHDTYGSFVIDSLNNKLIITARTHYYHDEWDHDEVTEYVFYNIGNTTVTIPDQMKNDHQIDLFPTDNFVENGIFYSVSETGFSANVTINECDDAYLGGEGTYTLRPQIDGIPVKTINYDYYYYTYYVDHSNYELNVYYNDDGYYQSEYIDAGFVKYYLDASKFGKINYYLEW